MSTEMIIAIKDLRIFAYHGLVAGEEIVGSDFKVELTATYIPQVDLIQTIDQTLDYTVLLQIIKARMQQPTPLLETIAMDIASEIIAKFSIVTEVEVSIDKLHPPIQNFQGSVGIIYKAKRDR